MYNRSNKLRGEIGLRQEQLRKFLDKGEGFVIEFKECVDGLNNSVFETVCSFSNRYGGYVFLGVT